MAVFIFVLRVADNKDRVEERSQILCKGFYFLLGIPTLSSLLFLLFLSLSRDYFHKQLQGEPIDQCKLHRSATSSTLLQDLANWKISLNYILRFGWKGDKITASLKWDPEKKKLNFFFPIENECFRGNWHFPEENLGNWVWNLCISP